MTLPADFRMPDADPPPSPGPAWTVAGYLLFLSILAAAIYLHSYP